MTEPRTATWPAISIGFVLILIAVILFVLAAFAPIGDFDFQDLLASGLVFFAAGHIVP